MVEQQKGEQAKKSQILTLQKVKHLEKKKRDGKRRYVKKESGVEDLKKDRLGNTG